MGFHQSILSSRASTLARLYLETAELGRGTELRLRRLLAVESTEVPVARRLLLVVVVVRLLILVILIFVTVLVLVFLVVIIAGLVVTILIIAIRATVNRGLNGAGNFGLNRRLRVIGGGGGSRRCLGRAARARSGATSAIAGANLLRLTSISDTLESDALLRNVADLDTRNLGSITHVGVDTNKDLSVASRTARDLNMTSGHGLAVTAASVKLTKIGNFEILDDNSTTTVVLDNLVFGTLGATAVDGGGFAIVLFLYGEGILANGIPDNVVKSATTVTVNTLDLVRA